MPATTLEKIRIDIPFPMPRWVISSPSHMTKHVPVVSVRTMKAAFQYVKFGIRLMLELSDPRMLDAPWWKR